MIYLIIILAIITRFIPHMPNFAPITALAIFSGANMGWKKSVGLVLAARFVSDIFLGFFSWPLMVAVYACHLAGVLFGVWIKDSNNVIPEFAEGKYPESYNKIPASAGMTGKWIKIISSSLGASILFFTVTNFAFLYSTYPHNLAGIMSAYVNGLPFLRGTILGDLSYTIALFGAYQFALYAKSISRLKRVIA